jgi:CubicO group peptidase (beta-lactamase class C family)
MARALFGQIAITGRIPVHVPNVTPLGHGLDVSANEMTLVDIGAATQNKLAGVYKLLDSAVTERVFPGGTLAIGHSGALALHSFGKHTYEPDAPPVNVDTIYDAASLTKPVVTASLVAMLTEAREVELDAPVARYLPEWAAAESSAERQLVTIRHLLTHTSGLPAHKEFFRTLHTKREVLSHAVAEPLIYAPGSQSIYSDIGFIVLGEVIERVTGRPLDDLANQRIFAPLRMAATSFNPPNPLLGRIPPTEFDSVLRNRLVHGEVHDENAWVMGGTAGHAGMFSTAADLAAFCQMLLNGGVYAHRRLLRRATVAQFTSAAPLAANTRTLGWNVPTPNSSSGQYFSKSAFGHTGFTGTSLWLDPEKSLFVVLLTNRTYPSRDNDSIQRLRPALHDAIVKALGLQP